MSDKKLIQNISVPMPVEHKIAIIQRAEQEGTTAAGLLRRLVYEYCGIQKQQS